MNAKNERGFAALRLELKREREKVKRLTEELEALRSESGLYEAVSGSEVKNRIINEYLHSLAVKGNVPLISAGLTALTPTHRPKNLADAKRLADKIIKA